MWYVRHEHGLPLIGSERVPLERVWERAASCVAPHCSSVRPCGTVTSPRAPRFFAVLSISPSHAESVSSETLVGFVSGQMT